MTFTEAALEILKREGKPLHFKDLTERAMTKKLLTFVGRTPEVTMQTQLTAAVKKAPGNPFVRVKPGIFGLLRYPEVPPEDKESVVAAPSSRGEGGRQDQGGQGSKEKQDSKDRKEEKADDKNGHAPERRASEAGDEERGRRRRRRGGRGRTGAKEVEAVRPRTGHGEGESAARRSAREATEQSADDTDEPATVGLSPEARAAALAETGVLEGDDDMTSTEDDEDDMDADTRAPGDPEGKHLGQAGRQNAGTSADPLAKREDGQAGGDEGSDDAQDGQSDDGQDDAEGAAFGSTESADGAKPSDGDDPARRRRRRRRRRRGSEGEGDFGGQESQRSDETGAETPAVGGAQAGPAGGAETGVEASSPGGGEAADSNESSAAPGQAARRIMAPVDAAIEILRGQPPGRGVHVRQIADSAIRRRLIHGEPNEAWRVIRTSLAAEPKDRLRNGLRPRVRAAGSGLYALARRTPDAELEKAEQVFGEARRALRERTIAALEKRITELPPGAFEALARVLLQREGFGPTTFVKRVEGTIYVEALRGRGSRPSKCLIALRPGSSTAGRRSIGELRAGIRARSQDEGLLMLSARLAEDAISEWKQPGAPLEIADGAAMAETCARHGVGVLSAVLNVDFVDADFFAELAEG